MSVSMFEAINTAVEELQIEARRVAVLSTVAKTITCGDLQKILDNAHKSTKLLKKIQGVPPCPKGVGDSGAYSRGYLDALSLETRGLMLFDPGRVTNV